MWLLFGLITGFSNNSVGDTDGIPIVNKSLIHLKLKLIDDCRKGWTARNGKYWAKSENIS